MGKWQQHTRSHGPKFANQPAKYQDDLLSYFRRQGPYTKALFESLEERERKSCGDEKYRGK